MKLLDSDVSSELLPDAWNSNAKTYALRYQSAGPDKVVYVLLGTINTNDTIVLNLLVSTRWSRTFHARWVNCANTVQRHILIHPRQQYPTQMDISNVQFNINAATDTIRAIRRTASVDAQAIVNRLRDELLAPVMQANTRQAAASTQTTATTATATAGEMTRDPLRVYHDRSTDRFPIQPNAFEDPLARNVGRRDLDPFAGGGVGGGMLFDPPMRPGGGGVGPLMPGRVPGARFDPFGPLGPTPHAPGRPNNDHFRPPGFDDDFYM